jgi:phosphoribosyl-dephospho-CoA transferase
MPPELRTHTLLRIAAAEVLRYDTPPRDWVSRALGLAPWVVVRRGTPRDGMIPVGARGVVRSERCAAWLRSCDVLEALDPLELAARRAWRAQLRCAEVPALAALAPVDEIMRLASFGSCWGPTGSVGFELASGRASATPASDLDLMVRADQPLERAAARALLAEFALLPVRVDALLETPRGAVALAEYASAPQRIVLRTASGAGWVADPWAPGAAAA